MIVTLITPIVVLLSLFLITIKHLIVLNSKRELIPIRVNNARNNRKKK